MSQKDPLNTVLFASAAKADLTNDANDATAAKSDPMNDATAMSGVPGKTVIRAALITANALFANALKADIGNLLALTAAASKKSPLIENQRPKKPSTSNESLNRPYLQGWECR